MFSKLATYRKALVAGLVLGAMSVSLPADAARGKKIDYNHIINLAGMQRMITQQMSKETILLAMGVEKDEHIRQLRSSQALFDRTLRGLREGDVALQLPATENPAILEDISRVDELWSLYNTAVQEGLTDGTLSRASIAIVADLSMPLLKAMGETVQEYKKEAASGDLFSVLAVAIGVGGEQRMLTQKMTKEFLLVAYGHDTNKNRQDLEKSIEEFDNRLQWMLDGNFEVQLLPAPTPDIRAQLRRVQQHWDEFRPMRKVAPGNGTISPAVIEQVSRKNMTLLKEMDVAVQLYEGL